MCLLAHSFHLAFASSSWLYLCNCPFHHRSTGQWCSVYNFIVVTRIWQVVFLHLLPDGITAREKVLQTAWVHCMSAHRCSVSLYLACLPQLTRNISCQFCWVVAGTFSMLFQKLQLKGDKYQYFKISHSKTAQLCSEKIAVVRNSDVSNLTFCSHSEPESQLGSWPPKLNKALSSLVCYCWKTTSNWQCGFGHQHTALQPCH